jgi:Cu/Ag efflux protein CusF
VNKRFASAAAVGLLAVTAAGALAETGTTGAAAQKITPSGVGSVKIGERYTTLRRQKLIGKIRPGCELGGPNTRSAPLKSPLKGTVNFTLHSPRRVTDVTVRGGATARGVGIGATVAQIKAAYPKAKVDHSTDSTFQVTLVRIPKSGGGRIVFAVDTTTKKVTLIGVPIIAFCE